MKLFIAAVVAACISMPVTVLAQSSPSPGPSPSGAPAVKVSPAPSGSPAASPSPSPSPTPRAWVTTGFADTTFTDAGTGRSLQFANGNNSRVFDTQNIKPMLNNLNLQLIKNGAIGGKIELSFGSDADVLASFPTANNNSNDVTNAYLSGTVGPLTLIFGKFSTLAGAEVLESPSDLNISRSILFGYAVPFTHTGARLTWAATSAFSVIAGINNGWDNTKGVGGPLTAEGGLAYNNKNLTITTQGYSGTERVSNAAWQNSSLFPPGFDTASHRSLIDAVVTYKFGPVITGTVNYDHGYQGIVPYVDGTGALTGAFGPTNWNGIAGYVNAAAWGKLSTTARYEYFSDPQGYRSSYGQKWQEGTLTFQYAPSSQLLFRLEGRHDISNQLPWSNTTGKLFPNLTSVAAEGIVKF